MATQIKKPWALEAIVSTAIQPFKLNHRFRWNPM